VFIRGCVQSGRFAIFARLMPMRTLLLLITAACIAALAPGHCRAEGDSETVQCSKSANFLAPLDSPDRLKYAPDREVEVLHLALEVTPDFKQRTVEGTTTLRFKPIAKPVQEIKLDAVDLTIHSVTATEKIQAYQVTTDKLIITFAEPIPPGREASVTIKYFAEPAEGLYFRTPEMGYKPGDTHLFTQGEEILARHWYPCFDSPNEKFTSEVTCRVPQGMTVISNGRLIEQRKDPATRLDVFHWSQEKPHANYLITLVAGYLSKIEDKYRDIPLAFYTPPSEIRYATNSFRDTKDMLAFYEQEIGVPYPWPKYDQVCVNDFVEGGMENTTAATLTDYTLFTDATENIRSSDGLIAHELAHQWFGDLVTCKDWSQVWLNEGFATFYESLYQGHKHGNDEFLYGFHGKAKVLTSVSNDVNAVVRRSYDSSHEMFTDLSYVKGAWVLRMLRSELGEDLFRRCIKTYLDRHACGNVVSEDLRAVIEELSGRSYDQFFDQWLYHAHYPELEITYNWDESTRLAKLSVRQTQQLSQNALLFKFPLKVRFKGKFGAVDRQMQVSAKEEDFYFPLDSAPKIVRVDPGCEVLSRTRLNLPNGMLFAQLEDKDDALGRIVAIEQLADKKDKETVIGLNRVLNDDAFPWARIEASRALRAIHSDEALEALLSSTRQSDARVRRQVMDDISGFYQDTAYDSARQTLESEKNPDILSAALHGVGGYAKPQVQDTLLKFLHSESFRNQLAVAAIGAIRSQDSPDYIAPLRETLASREKDFTSFGFAEGLRALGYLTRNEEKKDVVRDFLLGYVNHKKLTIQLASMNALGALGDPAAIAVLEKFSTATKESPQRTAAERAVAELRAGRKPVDDFKNLRQDVLDLQKASRDLRKELDDLKKKTDAKRRVIAEPPSRKKPAAASPKNKEK
jgi:aminopeptidase N